jgi:hypothetical protein
MSAYKDALTIDDTSPEHHLVLAAEMLERCTGVVLLNDVIALRPTPTAILCEFIELLSTFHRCAEEFKVLIENAQYALARSALSSRLPRRPLRWLVVEDKEPTLERGGHLDQTVKRIGEVHASSYQHCIGHINRAPCHYRK